MGTLLLLRRILRMVTRDAVPGSPLAEATLQWCVSNAGSLGLENWLEAQGLAPLPQAPRGWAFWRARSNGADTAPATGNAAWDHLVAALAGPDPEIADDRPSSPLALCGRLASLLGLSEDEAQLMQVVVAITRLDVPASLVRRLRSEGLDVVAMVGALCGYSTVEAVAQSQPVRLGLVGLVATRGGQMDIYPKDALQRVLDGMPVDDEALIECTVGARVRPALAVADFTEQADTVDLLRRMLSGALRTGAEGINILLYGPPGTGKTELAKVLAEAAGAALYVVGEVTEHGEEPTRWDRVMALKLAQRVLVNRRDAVLLFDEMEDMIRGPRSGTGPGSGLGIVIRDSDDGSKVFVNRMLETNPVPTLWTSNHIGTVDSAFLRRMSYVLRMDLPRPAARRRIFGRVAQDERLGLSDEALGRLAETAPEAATVARNAVRTARLAEGGEADAERALASLVAGIRHGCLPPPLRASTRA